MHFNNYTPIQKGWGILKRAPKSYQNHVLWAWLEFFSPLRGANCKTTHYLLPCVLCKYFRTYPYLPTDGIFSKTLPPPPSHISLTFGLTELPTSQEIPFSSVDMDISGPAQHLDLHNTLISSATLQLSNYLELPIN